MKKILLIEDNLEVRENIAEILELANYKVETAENGKTGVEKAKATTPDLIICDVMMPELDGFGVLHVLNKNMETANIPFIFLTAKAEKNDLRKGMNLGADDYITKPFDDLELLDAIEIRLKKSDRFKEELEKNTPSSGKYIQEIKGLKELENMVGNENKTIHIPKKHFVYSQGSYPNYLYFLTKGKIKTCKNDQEGNEFITALFKEGDFIGYLDLLENTKYGESAVVLEDAEVCTIKREDFFSLVYHNRDVANKFIKMLSGNVVEREERLLKLAYKSVRKRVAEALLQLRSKYMIEGNSEFSMAISRDNISGLVGASKETVIRALTDFKEEGFILVTGSKITIVNSEKLSKIKN